VAPARILAGCAKKILRKPAPEDEKLPRFLKGWLGRLYWYDNAGQRHLAVESHSSMRSDKQVQNA
jgi:hypothetical protein